MSAQCTDERVNKITARIFPKYNTPEKMGALSQEQLEEEIRDCGPVSYTHLMMPLKRVD